MKLIDKDVLTEKLWERRMKHCDFGGSPYSEYGHEDDEILSLINSLEVKEVDLDEEADNHWGELSSDVRNSIYYNDYYKIAKHFFELGLKAKNWEKARMQECPYRQVKCTMYEDKILECNGACSWVVDYPKLKEFKAQKGE